MSDTPDNVVPIGIGEPIKVRETDLQYPYTGPLTGDLFIIHANLQAAGFTVTLRDRSIPPNSLYADYDNKIVKVNCLKAQHALQGLERIAQCALSDRATVPGVYAYVYEGGELCYYPDAASGDPFHNLYLVPQRILPEAPTVAPLTRSNLQVAVIMTRGTAEQRAQAKAFFDHHFDLGIVHALAYMLANEQD